MKGIAVMRWQRRTLCVPKPFGQSWLAFACRRHLQIPAHKVRIKKDVQTLICQSLGESLKVVGCPQVLRGISHCILGNLCIKAQTAFQIAGRLKE